MTDQAVNIREAVDEFMLKFIVALAVVMIVSSSASAGAWELSSQQPFR